MTNIRLGSIEEYQDVATINTYHSFRRRQPEQKRLKHVHIASRDSARTPVQWSGEENAGFSPVKPWFAVNPNYREINAEKEEGDPESILNFYRRCLRLRKGSETLLWGDYREYFPLHPQLYVYERSYGTERILVVCSFSGKELSWQLPGGYAWEGSSLLLCNYREAPRRGRLRPYETQVLRWNTNP